MELLSKSSVDGMVTLVVVDLATGLTDKFDLCLEFLDADCGGVESRLSADRALKLLLISIYIDVSNKIMFLVCSPTSRYY